MFLNGIVVANETLGDKISGVCLRAIKFLGNLCSQSRPRLTEAEKRQIAGYSDFLYSVLIEKLGDNL